MQLQEQKAPEQEKTNLPQQETRSVQVFSQSNVPQEELPPTLPALSLQERILLSEEEFSKMTHQEYLQAIKELKEKFENQEKLIDFSLMQKLSTPFERIVRDDNDKKQQSKLVDQANNWIKKLDLLIQRNQKEFEILGGEKILKATERKAYLEALNAYADLETKISARKNEDYPSVDDSTLRYGIKRKKGAVKRGFDAPVHPRF